jgi:hypothetical protein
MDNTIVNNTDNDNNDVGTCPESGQSGRNVHRGPTRLVGAHVSER